MLESRVQLNRCSLPFELWLTRAPSLYRNNEGLYLANGLIENPKTVLWHFDLTDLNCYKVPHEQLPTNLELVPSSHPNTGSIKAYDPIAPLFSKRFIIVKENVGENFQALWSFRGKHIRRPEYRFSLMRGKASWELNSSYIGQFSLEVYRGDERLFILARSVYGATWAPSIADYTLNWDPANKILVVFDQPPKTGIFYWARIED